MSQHGVKGFYSGLSVTLLEIMPYAALQFGLYDLFTTAAANLHHSKEVTPECFVISMCHVTMSRYACMGVSGWPSPQCCCRTRSWP